LLYGVNLLLVVIAGLLLFTRNSLAAYVVVILGGGLIFGSRLLGYFRFSRLLQDLSLKWKDSQKAKYLAFRTRLLAKAFEIEKTLPGRWELAGELFKSLGIQQATFTPVLIPDKPLTWKEPQDGQGSNRAFSLSLSLLGEKGSVGTLEIIWNTSPAVLPPGMSKILALMANEFCHGLDPTPSSFSS
jgi:hypothetical protein